MKFFAMIMLAVVSTSTYAQASQVWPDSFNVVCGDLTVKVPFDPKTTTSSLSQTLTGTATRIPDSQLGGYYTGGLGYSFKVSIADAELFGTSSLTTLTLNCAARDVSDVDQAQMKCGSDLQSLPAVKDFNMLEGSMPVPGPLSGGQSTITIRRMELVATDNSETYRFYQLTRELICTYTK